MLRGYALRCTAVLPSHGFRAALSLLNSRLLTNFISSLPHPPLQATNQWGAVQLDSTSASAAGPCARGWFACTSLGGDLLLHGGLDYKNERLDDMFVLRSS